MLHVAVLLKPYLDLVLSGQKTVECRLTRQAREPFDAIEPGERIHFKQSAGPYRAVAVAGHVLFERDLTPRRVRQLRRDYNDQILGEADFWNRKLTSRFATLIWLRDVQPCDDGPAIRPLQGQAWSVLRERHPMTGRSRRGARSADESFQIVLTPGNLRNNSLYVSKVLDRFPAWAIGGRSRRHAARSLTLLLDKGPSVQTDIVGPRRLLRSRRWGPWFRRLEARPGDCIVFTPADESTYFVSLRRAAAAPRP
jgi:ASC-1-like (ASCH) protein